jgi:uncharacterized membrane protein
MSLDPGFLPLLAAMAAASFTCRAGGFWLMWFVPATPRLEAALKATPLAVMVALVAPVAARGEPASLAALAVVLVTMRLVGSDLVAALAGVAVVALLRAA